MRDSRLIAKNASILHQLLLYNITAVIACSNNMKYNLYFILLLRFDKRRSILAVQIYLIFF